jgi:hypothetical protein
MPKPPSRGKQAAPGVTFTPEPTDRLSSSSSPLPNRYSYGEMGEQGELPTYRGEHRRERLGEGVARAAEELARRRPIIAGVAAAAVSGEVKGRIPLNKRK